MKKFLKILLIVLSSIIGLFIVVIGGLNIAKFFIYNDYYEIKENVCTNPGLNDGFVPQGIAVVDDNIILTSGYMDDKSPSRIYIIENGESRYVEVSIEGKNSTAHLGGIAYSNNMVYIANGSKIQTVSLTNLLEAEDKIDLSQGIKMIHKVSYCFADDKYLYVGEYHDDPGYVCEHEIQTPTTTNYALCTAYSLDDLTTPVFTYSIGGQVQGFAVTENGSVVLSTSRGVNSSKYLVYEKEDIIVSEDTYLDLPLYILDVPTYSITGPAMSEDLSIHDGEVYCLTESACNKYIFGKFFFAYNIYKLDIE